MALPGASRMNSNSPVTAPALRDQVHLCRHGAHPAEILPQHPCRGACRAGFARAWGHRLNVRQDGLPGIGLSFPGRGCVRDPGLGDAMRAQKLMERRVGVFQRVEQGGGAAL